MPAAAGRSSAPAPGLSEPTPATSTSPCPCSWSRIACRLVPLPEARTTIRKALTAASSRKRNGSANSVPPVCGDEVHRVESMSGHDFWQAILYLHLLAMAFFVGGQLVFGIAVVPVLRGDPDDPGRERMRGIARRFGYGSLNALGILVLTGRAMASHYELWDSSTLQW